MTWPTCGGDPAAPRQKLRYPTAELAKRALLDTRIKGALRPNSKRHETKFYWCKFCAGFHLTSKG